MRAFQREADGTVTAELTVDEVTILVELAGQLSQLLRQQPDNDAAVHRLLPDAYPDDHAASEEFARFTSQGLVERKLATASAIVDSIKSAGETGAVSGATPGHPTLVRLDPSAAQSWLTAVGDLRLVIAARLGIVNDGDEGERDSVMAEVYEWLAYVQGSLVEALEQA